jgi:hypothetical protein
MTLDWKVLVAMGTVATLTLYTSAQNLARIQMAAGRVIMPSALDSKTAKAGDPIKMNLEEDVAIPGGGMDLPKGSQLTGRVMDVSPSQSKSTGSITIVIDTAILPGGKQVSIKTTLLKIVPPSGPITSPKAGPGILPPPQVAMEAGGSVADPWFSGPMLRGQASNTVKNPEPGVTEQTVEALDLTMRSSLAEKPTAVFTHRNHNVRVRSSTEMYMAIAELPVGTNIVVAHP